MEVLISLSSTVAEINKQRVAEGKRYSQLKKDLKVAQQIRKLRTEVANLKANNDGSREYKRSNKGYIDSKKVAKLEANIAKRKEKIKKNQDKIKALKEKFIGPPKDVNYLTRQLEGSHKKIVKARMKLAKLRNKTRK